MHSRQALRIPILAAAALALALAIATVASGAPALSITGGPDGPTRDTTPGFTFETDGVTVECSIDQGIESYGPCTGATAHTSSSPLADGTYTFRVRATDAIPEQTVATRTFTVDTDAPAVSISSGPTGPVSDDTPTFTFTGEPGATIECSVDLGSASYGPCGGAGTHTPATLPDDDYTFRVRATDAAGNTSTAIREFRVDTVAPESTIESQALGTTDDQTPEFEFSASEGSVTFQCRFDGPTFTACSSPRSYGPLAEGPHTFAVRATDAAGNVGAEDAETFTVDLTNPELAIVSGPDGATPDSTPTFGFNAEGGTTVQCSVDQGTASWGSCSGGGSHAVTSPLTDGSWVFRVRASDGPNETIETQQFSVDTVAPDTSIVGGPSGLTNSASPAFSFSANESGTSFECRRDSEPSFAPCTSPKAYQGLPDGAHTFQVRAVDAAGNIDGSVSSVGFTIDTVAPVVSISFGPSGTTNDDSPLFEFSIAGASATDCSIDRGTPAFGPCSSGASHVVTQRLAPGAYVFRVRGTDAAGNATTATRTFTVAGPGGTPPPTQPPTTSPRLMSPFPLVRLTGRLTRTGAKVQVLSVRAPRGALARVSIKPKCAKGRRCPAKQGRATVGAKGLVRFKKLELGYRAGTTIEVRVSQTGPWIGKYTRFVVRRGKAPQRVDRCLMPGATRGSACPAG